MPDTSTDSVPPAPLNGSCSAPAADMDDIMTVSPVAERLLRAPEEELPGMLDGDHIRDYVDNRALAEAARVALDSGDDSRAELLRQILHKRQVNALIHTSADCVKTDLQYRDDPTVITAAVREGKKTHAKHLRSRLRQLGAPIPEVSTTPPLPEGVVMLPFDAVIAESALQMREHSDAAHVAQLREAIEEGATLPPLEVYQDDSGGSRRWYLADGFHRRLAWQQVKATELPCRIMPGGREAAVRRSLSANSEHNALRRTNADKRKAVVTALKLMPKGSLREIAELCAVTNPFVHKIKKEVLTVSTPNSGSAAVDAPATGEQLTFEHYYTEFARDSFKPFETKFLDVLGSKYWAQPEVPLSHKLQTCTQVEDALEKQLKALREHKDKIKQLVDGAAKAAAKEEARS